MADKKISALDAIVSVDDADVLPIVDSSATTTKKINVSQVKELAPVQSVASKTGAVSLVKGDVGLGNVDNTADADKPVSSATQTALDAKEDTITGAATTITGTDLTASRAVTSSATGKIEVSSVTSTELGYVSGVTSAIQTQIDGKQATITGAATTIDDTDLTASRALVSDGSGKVAVSDVTSTELGYLDGVTSAIQTQVDSKIAKFDGTTYDINALSAVTQAEYDALTPSATTIYFII